MIIGKYGKHCHNEYNDDDNNNNLLTSTYVPLWCFGDEEHTHQERYRDTSAKDGQHLPVEVFAGDEAQQYPAIAEGSG